MSRCPACFTSRRATELSTPPDNSTAIFTFALASKRASWKAQQVSRGGQRLMAQVSQNLIGRVLTPALHRENPAALEFTLQRVRSKLKLEPRHPASPSFVRVPG